MAPSAGGTDTFSSDSVNQLNTFLGLASKNVYGGSPQCLINAATASWGEPVCGDGLRQDGEDCDCGADDCSAVDSCCNGATCTFKSGATCSALDACCNSGTCKSESKGTTCRGAASECDIKETCDGVAPTCSTDIFHYPGASCSDGITSDGGRCYLGACGSAAKQCAVDITSQYDGTYANVDSQDNDPCGTLRCSTGGASSNKYSYFPAVDGDGNLHVADGSPCKTAGIQTGGQCFNKECVLPAALAPTAVCGNQKVEPGEECDDPNDKCCNAATCKLTAAAVCSPSQGNCCDANTCQPKSASTTCRASTGECDVSEKCTGTSGRCPADEAVLMGTTCGNMFFDAGSGHTGSCFSGTCVTFKSQCVDTYGSSKTSCPQWAMLSWGGDPNKKKTKCDRLYCRDASATGSSVSCSTSSKPALQGSRCSAPEDNMFCDAAGECVAGPAKASDCNTATEFFDAGRGKCTACHSRCSGGCNGGSSAADCKNCATGSMRVGGFCVEGTSGKTCTCDNGVEAQGSACPADGAKVCASCTGNFFLQSGACKSWTDCNALGKTTTSAASNAANAVCGADKQCTCSNGNGAKGTACTTNGNAQCASCTGSFYLKNGACSQWTNCNSLGKTTTTGATNSNDAVCGADKQCTCPDGAGTKGTSCPSNGASLCASCAGSFFLKQGACNPWTVNCDVLGKVEATAATNSADAVCGADKTCLCATGTANTGTSCPTNGATSCRDADTAECLSTCGRSGPCGWCDKVGLAGKCCRKDFNGGEKGCLAEEGGTGKHVCVAAVAGSGWDDVVTIGVDNPTGMISKAIGEAVVGVAKRILLTKSFVGEHWTLFRSTFIIPDKKHIIIEGAVDDGKGGKGQATIDGGHFELGGNYVAGSGWIFGGTLELVNVRLIGGKKGSIYNYGGTVLVRDSRLESNVGGAAISTLWGASTTIISTVLANNGAGAILTERGGTVSLSDVTFVDNTGRDIWFKNYMSALFFFDRPSKFQKTGGTYDYDANILIDPNTVVYKVSATSPCPTGTSGTYTYACPIGTSGPDIWYVDGGRMFVTDESIADRSNPYPCPIGTIGSFRRPQFKVALNLANVNIVSFPTAPTCATCSGSGKYNDQTGQGDYHCHKSNGKKLYGPSKDCAANKPIDCCDPDIPEMTCKECPPGKVAAADTRASCVQNDCDAGKYAAVGGCTDCQKGRYRSESKHSNAECVLCGIGKYSDAEGATTCASCGEGKSVEPGAGIGIASCDDCSAGKFAAMAGDPEGCQDCFTGWYTADTGALVCKLCPAGKSHLLGERGEKVLANCKQCPAGKIGTPDASAAGTSGCQPCTEAKTDYQDEPGKGTCKVCRPGLQSNQKNDGCTCALPCDPGSYLEASSITCKPCPIGTFNPSYGIVGTESCLKCPAGRWSADTARPSLSGCTQCERGKKGPNNGQTTVNACVLCASETEYQDEPGKALCKSAACAKGTWGSSADTTVPPVCTACPAGKFNAARGLTSQEECSDCGLGRWSDTLGATGPNDCTLCGTGKYSISEGASQQSACISCSNGRYQNSKGGAFCAACAAGMYGDKPGQSSSAGSCTSCPAGKYSGATGLTGPHLCNACRPGTWLDAVGSTDPSDCKACDKGKASEAVGAAAESTCKGCLVGIQYQDESGKAVCKNMACPAGKYSTSGAVADVKSTCADCPKGTFSGLIGLTDISDCNDCSTGRYGDEVAQTRSVDCKLCAAGSSNPHSKKATSGSCKACGKGTYQPEAGQATCVACAKGTYGTTESETNPDKCNLCEKGKYGSAESKQQCDACPLGRYNNLRGSTAFDDCIQCPAGTYGSLPAETTKKCAGLCPWGTFSAMVGLTDRADCKLCSLGTYEDEAGQNSTTGCKVCPAGRANPVTGSTKAGDCVLCEKGTFQATNGAALCTQCPKGQYGDQVGQTSKAAACKLCLEGTYGSSLGGQTCDLCPAGRYSSSVGSMGFDGCVLCAGGTYGKRERERWREKCTHTTHT